jgi:hypothetical protein
MEARRGETPPAARCTARLRGSATPGDAKATRIKCGVGSQWEDWLIWSACSEAK